MRSAWIYPTATIMDGILGGVRLQCNYVHVVGAEQEWDIFPHSHDAVEFCCVLSGHGWYCTPDGRLKAEARDFFIAPPGEMHWETREPGHPFELAFLNMSVDGERAGELTGFFNGIRGRVDFRDDVLLGQALDIVMRVSEEAVGQRPGFISMIEAQLLSLCICLWRNSAGEIHEVGTDSIGVPGAPSHSGDVGRISGIKEYIWNNPGAELSLDAVARYFFYHPKYLSAMFKKETGMTFSDWVLMERLQRVKELLAGTMYSIESIAERMGFSSVPHLYRRFKEGTGMTPKAYRDKMRGRLDE